MKPLIISFFLFFFYTSNSISQEVSWSHWENKEKNIQMDYPVEWNATNFTGSDIITFLSPNKNNNSAIPEMITFSALKNNDNYTLNDLNDYIVNNVIKSRNGVLQSSDNIYKGDIEANVSVAEVNFNHTEYCTKIYSFIKNDDIYLLILISFKNNFGLNSQIIDKVFDSLDINR